MHILAPPPPASISLLLSALCLPWEREGPATPACYTLALALSSQGEEGKSRKGEEGGWSRKGPKEGLRVCFFSGDRGQNREQAPPLLLYMSMKTNSSHTLIMRVVIQELVYIYLSVMAISVVANRDSSIHDGSRDHSSFCRLQRAVSHH